MQITKDNDNLIVKIPLRQTSYDYAGEPIGQIDNIVGIIEGDKMGFAYVIDLGYKGSFDYTDIFLEHTLTTKKKFEELCKSLNIYCHEYETCSKCGKVLYGIHGWSDGGPVCLNCVED